MKTQEPIPSVLTKKSNTNKILGSKHHSRSQLEISPFQIQIGFVVAVVLFMVFEFLNSLFEGEVVTKLTFVYQSWVVYKESNWICAILWVALLVCLGSITTYGYVVLQFLKLSTQESLQDPIYFVLLRRQKKTETEQKRKCSLLTARILSLALSSLKLGILIYTFVTYGLPNRRDIFTPWMLATLVDFFGNAVALSVWVAYKESSWLSAAFLIILINLVGGTITCAYIALQLFSLSSQDPVYLVLFSSSSNREEKEGMKEPLKQTTWRGSTEQEALI